MECENVLHFLENKTILVTGVTGFLAKIFVEKILRVQPNVKKLYLLLRASNATSANERFHKEVIGKDLFKVAKEKLGTNLNSIISKKITVVPGDVSHEDLGIKDSLLREDMKNELDVVLNSAATTNFHERYDVALGTNTMGAKHVLCFAKSCRKLRLLIHVSTAYVCGERPGLILENPFRLHETLNGSSGLDIEKEKKLINKKLDNLLSQKASDATIKEDMKDMGLQRAKIYGWPNTYAFTKAMGEMVIGHLKGDLPLVIIRPTVVTSTYKEPFPGWIEGARNFDTLIISFGKGNLKFFAVDLAAIVDVIPADILVNTIFMAMVAHATQPCEHMVIYHVGSSAKNPVRNRNIRDYMHRYFTKKPWINENGKPAKVSKPLIFNSTTNLRKYVALRYLLPLKVLKLVDTISGNCFRGKYNYKALSRKIKFVIRLAELYHPYLFFHGIFDDSNLEKLLQAAKENFVDMDTFLFNINSIDWDDYFLNVHIPGVVKYAFKQLDHKWV